MFLVWHWSTSNSLPGHNCNKGKRHKKLLHENGSDRHVCAGSGLMDILGCIHLIQLATNNRGMVWKMYYALSCLDNVSWGHIELNFSSILIANASSFHVVLSQEITYRAAEYEHAVCPLDPSTPFSSCPDPLAQHQFDHKNKNKKCCLWTKIVFLFFSGWIIMQQCLQDPRQYHKHHRQFDQTHNLVSLQQPTF